MGDAASPIVGCSLLPCTPVNTCEFSLLTSPAPPRIYLGANRFSEIPGRVPEYSGSRTAGTSIVTAALRSHPIRLQSEAPSFPLDSPEWAGSRPPDQISCESAPPGVMDARGALDGSGASLEASTQAPSLDLGGRFPRLPAAERLHFQSAERYVGGRGEHGRGARGLLLRPPA